MKKKLLVELINYLEEYIYNNSELVESNLSLAHLYYLGKEEDNFNKNIEIFYKKVKDKNIYEIEKLVYFDPSFDVVLKEELYFFLENSHGINVWERGFIERAINFLESVSKDIFFKPYFLCELLKNMGEDVELGLCKKVLKNILKNYSNTKWEIIGLNLFSENLEKIYLKDEFKDHSDKIEFLNEFKEHLLYFGQKYPEETIVSETFFKLAEFMCKEDEYEMAIKLYSRISDIYSDEILKVKVLFEIGNIYYLKGNIEKAVDIYTELFKNFETRKEILQIKFESAVFLMNNKYYKNAFLIFREISRKFRNTKWATKSSNKILEMGKTLFEKKEYEEAEYFFSQIIKIKNNRDDSSWALYYQAEIYKIFSEIKFSYDKRVSYKIKSDEIFKRLIENYNDNKDILGLIDMEYFEKPEKITPKSFDLNYIILISGILILAIVLFLKMS